MPTDHQFHPTLLREYDIRGIIDQTLGTADAYAIGRGFGTTIRRSGGAKVVVGYDGRLSSPTLAQALIDGLVDAGCVAVSIGQAATPMLYFATHHLSADGGIEITGSHNPPDYNGFKFVAHGAPFFGAQIQALGALAAAGDWDAGEGRREDADVFDAYVDRLLEGFSGSGLPDRLGRRQRRGRTRRRGAGQAPAGRAFHAVHRCRRPFPQPPSGPDRGSEPGRP